MNEHACTAMAEQLNAGCHCESLDRARLNSELERVSQGFNELVMAQRPHLFSSSVTFVGDEHIRQMAALIAAIEQVVAMPAYQAHVLAHAPDIARHQPAARGVFMGYDFHVGRTGPQLIEINTNAGGGLLNALLARAQKACCKDVEALLPGDLAHATPEQMFLDMFRAEWQAGAAHVRRPKSGLSRDGFKASRRVTSAPRRKYPWGADFLRNPLPGTVAIVDLAPPLQYLYPEFLLFQRLFVEAGIEAVICDPAELVFRDGALWHGTTKIDLVYNRLTDFSLAEPASAALRAAYLADAAVITPHPRAHALYADKRNLVALSDADLLASWGVNETTRSLLLDGIPHTERVAAERAADFWTRRRQLFFKPATGYGAKAAYRGDKITKRVFDEVLAGDYVAQALVPPSQRTLQVGKTPVDLKVDLRNYVYAAHVQLIAARLWAGQTTNFRTPGGGFAPVLAVPCPEEAP
ncbi:MAG: hypothetical protein WBH09_03445 [Rugosibacter sp.]